MDASDLDQRITFEQRVVASRDTAFGAEVLQEPWPALPDCWAKVEDQVNPKKGGDESVREGMRLTESRTVVTVRWRNDIVNSMRIRWAARGRLFQITGQAEIGRREWLQITCEEYSA